MPNFSGDDELIGLAAQIQSAPGTYALVLGAGISISAGIKSGWQILEDLCRKISVGHGEAATNPTKWYAEKYGTEANYSTVLEKLADTPAGRNALVRNYIDPGADELESGLKVPTKAHRAIARMVRQGWIRLIVTLNFDDLLERALRDEGVTPVIISRAEDIETKPPFVHNACTLFKLHGHYTDFTTLNTGSELAKYAEPTQKLLDRILEDFGLITCGWSGQWDIALIEAVKRARSPYQVYFTSRETPSENAQAILQARSGTLIQIQSADNAFEELENILEALEMLKVKGPPMLDTAIALTKHYLSDPRFRLKHRDMILAETRRILTEVSDQTKFPIKSENPTDPELADRWKTLATLTLPLAGMLAATTAFGDEMYQEVIRDSIEQLGKCLELWDSNQNSTLLLTASLALPLVLAVYAAGMGAILGENSVGLEHAICSPQFPKGDSVLFDLHHDLPFLESPVRKANSDYFSPNPKQAGFAVGQTKPLYPNEYVLFEFLIPALLPLGYSGIDPVGRTYS
jgi:SIR2-like domain